MPDPTPDFAAQRCTCDDWLQRRARFMIDDPRRCCAHLLQGYMADPTSLPLGLARHQRRLSWFAGEAEGFPVTRQILALTLSGERPCEAYVPWEEDDPWLCVVVDGVRYGYHRLQHHWQDERQPPAALRVEVEAALDRALALVSQGRDLQQTRSKAERRLEPEALPPVPSMDPDQPVPAPPAPQPAIPPVGAAAGAASTPASPASSGAAVPSGGPRFQLPPLPDAAGRPGKAGGLQPNASPDAGPSAGPSAGADLVPDTERPGLAPWKLAAALLVMLLLALGIGNWAISRGPLADLLGLPQHEAALPQAGGALPGAQSAPAGRPGEAGGGAGGALDGALQRQGPVSEPAPESEPSQAIRTRQIPASTVQGDTSQAKAMLAFMREQPGAALYVLRWELAGGGHMELVVNLKRNVLARARVRADGWTEAEVHEGFVMERLTLAAQGGRLNDTTFGRRPPRMERFFTR